jgi:hypothetical protein
MATIINKMGDMLLWDYGFTENEVLACLGWVKDEIAREEQRRYEQYCEIATPERQIAYKEYMEKVNTCWEQETSHFPTEWLESFSHDVRHAALKWCVARLHAPHAD